MDAPEASQPIAATPPQQHPCPMLNVRKSGKKRPPLPLPPTGLPGRLHRPPTVLTDPPTFYPTGATGVIARTRQALVDLRQL
jgi:hypothetical protein